MRFLVLFFLVLSNLNVLSQSIKTTNPDSIKFNVDDVINFWSTFDQLSQVSTKADSLQIIDHSYLVKASRGLRLFLQMSNSDANSYLNVIRKYPKILGSMRANMLTIPTIKKQVLAGAAKLKKVYPTSIFPELFFCVGKFEVAGNREKDILYIGSEMTCLSKDTPRDEITNTYTRATLVNFTSLDAVCLHEITHYQQKLTAKTNLEAALVEGGAEFVTHFLTGKSSMQATFDLMNPALEKAIWAEFSPEMNKPIDAKWFLAVGDERLKRPGSLGYVIGFRLCENYYRKAKDKQEALRNIISLQNPQVIYQEAGY